MTIKYSYNTWPYSSFLNWVPAYTLEDTIKRLARIGYDGIEIGAAAPHAYPAYLTPERRKEVRGLLDASGIAIVSPCSTPTWRWGPNRPWPPTSRPSRR